MAKENNCTAFIPRFEFCTDNAAMVGIAGYYKHKAKMYSEHDISPAAKLNWI